MTTFIVSTLDDTIAVDGKISLREALQAANTDAAAGDAPAGSGADTINFAASITGGSTAGVNDGVITLGGTELEITSNVTIDGDVNGDGRADITLDANGLSRVILIISGTSTLHGLTITGGVASAGFGGGINNAGQLTLVNSTVTGNAATSGFRGGISSSGTLTTNNVLFSANTAAGGFGGALNISGTGSLTNTTFSANSANGAFGGAINNAANLALTNVTITGGTASFGGGIYNASILTMTNTIVAGNTAAFGGDLNHAGGTVTLLGDNVLSVAAGGAAVPDFIIAAITDIFHDTGINALGVDSGVLADNRGPTQTVAIKAGGIAHNAANTILPVDTTDADGNSNTAENLLIDARGFARQVGATVDIGALELQANEVPTLAVVSGITYTDTAGNDMFAAVSGTLGGDDIDGDDLIYGITGGTAGGATNIGGTVYDVSRISNFGTLYVASDSGAYTFVPRDAGIEALKAGASESFTVRVSDGTLNDTETLNITFNGANDAPLAAMGNQNVLPNEWIQVQGRLSAGDSDDAITQYQFYDAGAAASSGYFWTADLGRRADNTYVTIDADDLGTTWLRGGAATGGELMWVRAFNGAVWSDWDPFTLTTSSAGPGPNTAPVAAIGDQNLQIDGSITLEPLVSVSDADGDAIAQYQFYDAGTAAGSGYLWTANGGQRAAGQYITIAAADLGTVELRAGQAAGTDLMWVRAFDGAAWGAWDAFTLVTQEGANTAPVVTIDVQVSQPNASTAVTDILTTFDADGDPITQYQFYDAGAAADSGYFSTGGVQRDPHTYINVAAADLAGVELHGGAVGPSSELMWVRGFDGTAWSEWDPFFLIINGL